MIHKFALMDDHDIHFVVKGCIGFRKFPFKDDKIFWL